MGQLDQARTQPQPENNLIVNEPEKPEQLFEKFLFNLIQNFVQFCFYKSSFTVYSCATLS